MTTNNHPANGPVSLDRLHQIRQYIERNNQYQNGGNRAYILADVLKVIDEVLASRNAEPVLPDEKPMPEASKMHAIDAVAAIAEVRGWNACRAAMLSGDTFREISNSSTKHFRENAETSTSNPVSDAYKLAETQFKPVADLYALCWEPGDVVTYTPEPEKAVIWLNNYSGTCVQEYVTLERMQEVLDGNSPVTPDCWIPVSERMPDEIGRYWCYVEEQNSLGKSHYQWNCSWNGERWWVESDNGGRVTDWMPLPAAPQQEVKP
ncbi:DUF551 domain-containing protein [Citrobacter freundii]